MGLSSNQARFLSLTARQVDMEQRIQQICQRRLRLSSELENIATQYNNQISNRKMFAASQTSQGIQTLSIANLAALGYKVIGLNTDKVAQRPAIDPTGKVVINSEAEFLNLVNIMNGGDAAALAALSDNYVLNCDIDLSDNGVFSKAVIDGYFIGTFDGNGHTISGMQLTATGSDENVGFFSRIGDGTNGTVKNLNITNASIVTTGTGTGIDNKIGILAGFAYGSALDNISISNSTISLGDGYRRVGAMVAGSNLITNSQVTNVTITGGDNCGSINGFGSERANNCFSDVDIILGDNATWIGGFKDDVFNNHNLQNSYSTGSITLGDNANWISGFAGSIDGTGGIATNCYSTVDITTGANAQNIGGFSFAASTAVTNSYFAGTINTGTTPYTTIGGFTSSGAGSNNTNFYKTNINANAATSTAVNANINPMPTGTWDTNIWDLSGDLPILKNVGYTAFADDLETGLRNGTYSLAREADEFTQDPFSINGKEYEEIDWRSTPEIYDELYKGDDVEAENKYDKTVAEINAQDKKLQLEQTSVEVEYKAVSSEREAVKKILDTNAQSSFKYFS